MTGFINIGKALKPQSLYKFHFHESTLFKTTPQTTIINRVLLNNDNTQLIPKDQQDALQKSFDMIFRRRDEEIKNWGATKKLNAFYSQVYYPFLTKAQLENYFGAQNVKNIELLKNHLLKHVRLNGDALLALKFIENRPMFDYGIIRSSYFPSLGILNNYSTILKNSNYKLFKNHFEKDINYSRPLVSRDNRLNELILTNYLKKNMQLHKGITNLKNYFVINSPQQSEFFISLNSTIGVNTIVITGDNFMTPSSTIYNLIQDFEMAKLARNLFKCQEIHNQLTNMKLISVKNMNELMKLIMILQDPYLRVYDMIDKDAMISTGNALPKDGFNSTLNDLELSILGELETNPVYRL